MRNLLSITLALLALGCGSESVDERTKVRSPAASQEDSGMEPLAKENDALSFGIPNSFSGRLSADQDQLAPEALRGAFKIESLRKIKASELAKELQFKTQVAEEMRDGIRYVALQDFRHVQFSAEVSGQMIVIERYHVVPDESPNKRLDPSGGSGGLEINVISPPPG